MRTPNLNQLKVGRILPVVGTALAVFTSGCTGQLPGTFRYAQQEQSFATNLEINTKIDLLWVVDNSSSMDVSQDKLRKGFSTFAQKYMQPTWDIRVAVITTDAFLADPKFSVYLDKVVTGTGSPWQSPYMNGKTKPVTNPIFNPSTGMFDNGVKFKDLTTVWGPNYAKLLPGMHDGPIPGLCFEGLPYFLKGATQCSIRDDSSPNQGVANCLNPAAGESALTQCVNTIENNTIHSGRAIISTQAPAAVLKDPAQRAAWTNQLINDFMVNITTGSVGHGSERGLSSVLQLLKDNESVETAFFRPGSLRGIIFVSDEEDQSMDLPASPPSDFNPFSYYKCDQASLLAMNVGKESKITGTNGYCCSTPGNNCRYGSEGTSCASKTIDGFTYTPSICPREDKLIPVSSVKNQLDSFFTQLDSEDGTPAEQANYFVVSIVPLTGNSINSMQTERDHDDAQVGVQVSTFAVDRGDRYLELGNLVGNGSMSMNIADEDYSPILDAIGKSIVEKKGTFTLERAPTGAEDMIVSVIHADGSTTVITSDKFLISGKSLIITDMDIILGFASTDRIVINYQPKTAF